MKNSPQIKGKYSFLSKNLFFISKKALLTVLQAISNTVKDMGYIQGLNSIAGVFLFYLKEEESFWITLYFLEKLSFKEILQEGFDQVNLLNYQLKAYLNHYVPTVASYLVK